MIARNYCRNHIVKHYPEAKQLNVLMSGDQIEINKMNTFITACRAWSNQETPKLSELVLIKP
ncbi:hypothetical protein C5F64_08605 [Photobacterium damselae subsp. damselae]|nr:hypothetical protein C5F64_08605 [Photobacterium damselae subsp. damselae]